jgi:hypothetical protein
MTPNDQVPGLHPEHPDGLTPAQLRRFQLWRAMADLAKAQADGRLTAEQARMLESLADSLQQLAAQLGELAQLGQQCVQLLDPGPVPGSCTER